MEMLANNIDVQLALWETDKEFVLFSSPANNVWEFQLLPPFPAFGIASLLDFSQLLEVKWYLIVGLICIFLVLGT